MCYYSLTMPRGTYRSAKLGEDLTISHMDGHGVARANSDGMVTCVAGGTEAHIAKFEFASPSIERAFRQTHPWLMKMIGQPISARFKEGNASAADVVLIPHPTIRHDVAIVHMQYLARGTQFYLGRKREEITLEARLGVDEPAVIRDPLPSDEAPTLARTLGRALGVCSIVP